MTHTKWLNVAVTVNIITFYVIDIFVETFSAFIVYYLHSKLRGDGLLTSWCKSGRGPCIVTIVSCTTATRCPPPRRVTWRQSPPCSAATTTTVCQSTEHSPSTHPLARITHYHRLQQNIRHTDGNTVTTSSCDSTHIEQSTMAESKLKTLVGNIIVITFECKM